MKIIPQEPAFRTPIRDRAARSYLAIKTPTHTITPTSSSDNAQRAVIDTKPSTLDSQPHDILMR